MTGNLLDQIGLKKREQKINSDNSKYNPKEKQHVDHSRMKLIEVTKKNAPEPSIQRILFQMLVRLIIVLPFSVTMIITKTIVLSVNGSNMHLRESSCPWAFHPLYRTHPGYV